MLNHWFTFHDSLPWTRSQYSAFQDDNDCYIVMDLMLGGDIRYYLKRKPKGFDEGKVELA